MQSGQWRIEQAWWCRVQLRCLVWYLQLPLIACLLRDTDSCKHVWPLCTRVRTGAAWAELSAAAWE